MFAAVGGVGARVDWGGGVSLERRVTLLTLQGPGGIELWRRVLMQLAAGPTESEGSGIFLIHDDDDDDNDDDDDDGCSTTRCSQPAASDGRPTAQGTGVRFELGFRSIRERTVEADSRHLCGRMTGIGVVSYSSVSRADAGRKGMDGEAAVVRE